MASLLFPESILPTLAVGFLLVVLYFIYTNRRAPNIPPGPWSWPIVGALPSYMIGKMRGFDLMHEFLQELAKRYGDVCSIKLGKSLMVVLSEKDIARDAFQGEDFVDRPKSLVAKTQRTGKEFIHERDQSFRNIPLITVMNARGVIVKRDLDFPPVGGSNMVLWTQPQRSTFPVEFPDKNYTIDRVKK